MNPEPTRILLIEDDPDDIALVKDYLSESEDHSYRVTTAETIASAQTILDRDVFDVVLLDLSLPDSHGWETFTAIHEHAPQLPFVLVTGVCDESIGFEAVKRALRTLLKKIA